MNEQAEQALVNLLNLAIDGIEGAKAFTETQLPEVVEQLLMWKMLESLASTLFPFLLFVVSGMTLLTVLLKSKKSRDGDGYHPYYPNLWWDTCGQSDVAIGAKISLTMTTLTTFIATTALANLTWLQILVAPKVYLLEYASKLVS